MLSMANVGGSQDAGRYYEKTDDYYTHDQSPSMWNGKAAQLMGYRGEVHVDDFKKLLDGILPGGETIHVPEAGRRGGTDLTFSAPKSISLQAFVGGDFELTKAHHRAVTKTLSYAENLVHYRQTTSGITVKKSSQNMMAATFRHELSRACDPQLHTHCVVLNMTQREDKQWRAMDNEQFYKQKMLMGAFYRAALAREVQKLGYEIRLTSPDGLFELAHITDQQITAFSQRSLAIEEALKKDGKTRANTTPQEKQIITIATRPKKTNVDRKVLKEYWQDKSKELKIDYYPPLKPNKDLKGRLAVNIVGFALDHGMERQSVMTEPQIVREALQHGVGNVTYEEIKAEINRRVQKGILLQYQERYTTPQAQAREREILKLEKQGRNTCQPILKAEQIANTQLNKSQQQAVQHILTTTHQIVGVQGLAGTGKTTMLQFVKEKAEEKGFSLLGLAPSASAAETLSQTGIKSQTIALFQTQKVSSKNMIIVDEASMVSSAQMEYILREASKNCARVVLVGDVQQLKAVEAGKPFAQLQAHGMQTASMTTIRRQKNPKLKQAVELAARGQVIESVKLIQKSVKEIKKEKERYKTMAHDYTNLPENERQKTLIVSGTNEARKAINQRVRENLKLSKKGQMMATLEVKDLTKAQKKEVKNYFVGDLVSPQRNYSSLRLNKGEYYSVKELKQQHVILQKPDGGLLTWEPRLKNRMNVYQVQEKEVAPGELLRVTRNDRQKGLINGDRLILHKIDKNKVLHCKREDGKVFQLDGKKHLHVEYGYCSTVHSAQGKTCEKILIEADTQSLTSAKDSYYVAISRAREQAVIYTNNQEKLPAAMSRMNVKEAALELRTQRVQNYKER